jgi:hypothetical protein
MSLAEAISLARSSTAASHLQCHGIGNSGSSLGVAREGIVVVSGVSVVVCCGVYAVGSAVVYFVVLGEVGCARGDVFKTHWLIRVLCEASVAVVAWLLRRFVVRFVV